MTYLSWFESHANKHQAIVDRLTHLDDDALIAYFDFDNMLQHEPDFCPLYQKQEKCHDIKSLNCYLCACPHFRFDDAGVMQEAGKRRYSYCEIDAKDGADYVSEDAIHQDCSSCLLPHRVAYIKKHFSRDWRFMMRGCVKKG